MSRPICAAAIAAGAFLLVACGGAAPYGPLPGATAPADHGRPPQPPAWPPFQPPPPPFATPAATGAPYGGVEFKDAGINPFVDPARDPFSTFAMDVDTASYSVGKRFLADGHLPDRDSVRLEEYVNSFDYGYRRPFNSAFAIDVEAAPAPFVGSRALLLRIGIQARDVADQTRPPVALTFVIDTSGSMAMENRLDLVKDSLALLVSRLAPDDSVAIVQFGTDASIVLEPTSAAEPQAILASIDKLVPSGSTNAQRGLELGYDLAARGHRPGVRDRVVLASDGVANVGLTDADSILQRIDREVNAGVELVSVGVGMGNFNDVLLEQLADRGNGFYAYVNDRSEAEKLFGGRLTSAIYTIARDARVQVDFDSTSVSRYRLLGYENRGIADQDFNNPRADAGEVTAGRSVTALYEIEPAWGRNPIMGTVRLHWLDPDSGAKEELSGDIDLAALRSDFDAASSSFRLAATVGGFAEILRQSPYVSGYTLYDVDSQAQALVREFGSRADVTEFSQLTSAAARIDAGRGDSW
jgi:Ca-activated chloride channel homolog